MFLNKGGNNQLILSAEMRTVCGIGQEVGAEKALQQYISICMRAIVEAALAIYPATLSRTAEQGEFYKPYVGKVEKLKTLKTKLDRGGEGISLRDLLQVLNPAEYQSAIARLCIAAGIQCPYEKFRLNMFSMVRDFYDAAPKWGDKFYIKKRFRHSKLETEAIMAIRSAVMEEYQLPEEDDTSELSAEDDRDQPAERNSEYLA